MLKPTVSDAIVTRLVQWGVDRIFGYPGDGINGVFAALQETQEVVDFIQVRHEEMAAFMASAHAKFTGALGCCVATSGPGAIHLLTGLYDAKLDHAPVVVLVGQTRQSAMGAGYQQEVDLVSLFKDVAHEYVQQVTAPEQIPMVIDRAARIALDRRTVTCVILPADVQEEAAAEAIPHEHNFVPGGLGYERPRVIPSNDALNRAAAVLNAGERIAMLVGQGARGAADEVIAVAETLQAGVAKALLGKDVLPDDLPFVTGAIGLLGTKPSYAMMMNCDTLLVVGSNMPYSEFYPRAGQARGVQIDIDGTLIGVRYPMEVALVGDAKETLAALLPRLTLSDTPRIAWRQWLERETRDWWKIVEARAMLEATPINPQRLFWELSPRLPDDAIVTCDSGSAVNWYARDVKLRRGMRASLSGGLASMGGAVPYAIAAKLAFPARPVIALVGDGAMEMNGMNELLTLAKYCARFEDPRFVVLVLNNRDLNLVTWEQRAMGGFPKFPASQDLPPFNFASFAELCGLKGIRVEKPDDIGRAWDDALLSDRPVVIDALTDPDVPPLPPHIELKQATKMMSAIMKGDPDAWGIVRQSFKQKLEEIKP